MSFKSLEKKNMSMNIEAAKSQKAETFAPTSLKSLGKKKKEHINEY